MTQYHRHLVDGTVHADGAPECETFGPVRQVFVFDQEELEEHNDALLADERDALTHRIVVLELELMAQSAISSDPGGHHGPANARRVIASLRARRYALRITQRALAERIGVRQAQLASWEKGRIMPMLDSVCKWAVGLGGVILFAPPPPVGMRKGKREGGLTL